jgi:catalase
MTSRPPSTMRSLLWIAVVIAAAAVLFAYTAGWLSPHRLTPNKLVAAFVPPDGAPPLGHRRNHSKGICFGGVFEANGAGSALSRAQIFARGQYPVLGRFSLATADPNAPDATVPVRAMALRIQTPDGHEWRTAMIDAPFFAVSTPQAFYELLLAAGSKDPHAIGRFAAAHPEFGPFGAWTQSAHWTGSYAEERYNSLDSFVFTDNAGGQSAVRWSFVPMLQPVLVPQEQLAKRGANFLAAEITERVRGGPVRWSMMVTIANPGDPTADPSKAWPEDRRVVAVGTLVVQRVEPERDGPCRDINFDPSVLPPGIRVSDDPFPAARSSAYAKSYDLRSAEVTYYPRTAPEAKP